MSGLIKRAYIITLNGTSTCVIFASGAYSLMIMDDMRLDHFEEVYGIPITAKTKTLEEQYEKEYTWDCLEIESITTADAEIRCEKIMKRAVEAEDAKEL